MFVEKGTIKESIRESLSMILNYKSKSIFVTLTLFIYNLLTNQHSSRDIKLHVIMFAMLNFPQKTVPASSIQSVISRGESVEILILFSHWTTIFCMNDGSSKLMANQITFSTWSSLKVKLIAFMAQNIFLILSDIVLALLWWSLLTELRSDL